MDVVEDEFGEILLPDTLCHAISRMANVKPIGVIPMGSI
jgi:hypothetical protein